MATWMLKHFGSGSNNDAVLGDLAEQYVQNGSTMWYWRQAMQAIPVSFFREIRAHKVTAAKALLTGWVLWILGGMLIFPVAFYGTNVGFEFEPSHPIGSLWSFMWMPVLGPVSSYWSFPLAVALPLIVGLVCGWLVGRWEICAQRQPLSIRMSRVQRDQQTGVVLLFAGSILLLNLLLAGPFVLTVGSQVAYIFSGLLAANVAASVVGVLFGGGLFGDRSRIANS